MLDVVTNHDNSWAVVVLAAIIAIVIALVAHAIIFAALRRLGRYSAVAGALAEYTQEPARTVLPLIALQMVIGVTPPGLAFESLIRNGITLLVIGAMTWLALRAVAGVAEGIIRLHPTDAGDNLDARRIQTQTRVLGRTVMFFIVLLGSASALMLFPDVRQIGTALLASAGLAGLIAGIAARPVLASLIAGLQIALTQPIRLDDVVIMENEWGRVEEITATYVVVKVWDERRLIVPLQWVIEHPFQNWTRTKSQLLGTVFVWVDYCTPLAPLRAELERICRAASEWDRRVALIQVADTNERAMQLRALVSAGDASRAWDLRCRVREGLIDFLQRNHPEALPRVRAELEHAGKQHREAAPTPAPPPGQAGVGESSAVKRPTPPEVQEAGDARAPVDAQDSATGKGD